MLYIIIGCLSAIIIFLICYKYKINKSELALYEAELRKTQEKYHAARNQLEVAEQEYFRAKNAREYNEKLVTEYEQQITKAEERYNALINERMQEINELVEDTSKRRMAQLQETFEEAKSKYDLQLKEFEDERKKQAEEVRDSCIEAENKYFEECNKIRADTEYMRQQYEALLEPIKQYLKDKQEKYFYTIQLPEEFQEDIEFLLTTVAAKVQHPDIISKLVWAEYVKPNLDNTFKRIEIKAEPGIYKLTSLENGMAYIGKSTDVKKRIADHFKSSIGIRSIADQAVHHAILKEGFWNWSIEIITYAEKEKLNELEKYYIEFFKTQEFGYNKNSGGGG